MLVNKGKSCSIQGCQKPAWGRGWCVTHYDRWRRTGDPMKGGKLTREEKFLSLIFPEPMSGCWLWEGNANPAGYGQIWNGKTIVNTHRFSYEYFVGPIPSVNGRTLHVCHRCDTPACVNPDHLFLGTAKDNVKDMDKKGRSNRPINKGEKAPASKLSEADVLRIRKMGGTYRDISEKYGITPAHVGHIKHNRCWAHLPDF